MKEEEQDSGREALFVLSELRDLFERNLRTFIVLGLLGVLGGLLAVSREAPVYRSEATLRLDDDSSAGVLGDLVELTSTPKAVSEMEVISSRSIAEDVVLGEKLAQARLTTAVDSSRLAPLNFLTSEGGDTEWERRGRKPQLSAVLEPDPQRFVQPTLQVSFLTPNRVRISKRGPLFGLGVPGSDSIDAEFEPGARIAYDGLQLSLRPHGDLTGETFYISTARFEDAVRQITENTRVSETARNSNVIRLVYEDSDPERAANTVNAICQIYLDRNQERNEKRASQTVNFIENQLKEQLAKLEAAEMEVVELQKLNPKSVDIGVVGESLITQISGLQLEEIQLRMLLGGIREALELLNKGDFNALSRLDEALSDPVTANYIEQMILLHSEVDLLARADSSAYKGMVQTRALNFSLEADAVELDLKNTRRVLEQLQNSESGSFGAILTKGRVGAGFSLLEGYMETWHTLDSKLRELLVDYKEEMPSVQSLRTQIGHVERRVLEFFEARVASLDAQHTEYRGLLHQYEEEVGAYPDQERSKISVALDGLQQRTLTHLTNRMTGLYSRLSKLEDEQGELDAALAELPEEVRVLADPMRRREAHSEIVTFLLARQKEAEITRASTVATAEFIDVAIPARKPRGPLVPLFLMGGLVVGLGLALALAFVRQSFDRGVYTAEELERSSGLTLFGSIPDYSRGVFKVAGDRDSYLALRDDPEGPVAESYRSLRSNLKFVLNTGQADLELRTLAFTSCTQSEGKSVTNVDMALSFALAGSRVLLVDADMRRPSANRYLGIDLTPGLSDILKGEQSWRDCVQPEILPNVDVIPAGRQPASPGDLLAGEATGHLIREVREAYDIVVFDVPPVLAVADIDCLASKLDAVLLVTRSGKLSQKVVQEGVRRLDQVGANVVGCVLNATRRRREENKYGYGYGYGYGSDYKETA